MLDNNDSVDNILNTAFCNLSLIKQNKHKKDEDSLSDSRYEKGNQSSSQEDINESSVASSDFEPQDLLKKNTEYLSSIKEKQCSNDFVGSDMKNIKNLCFLMNNKIKSENQMRDLSDSIGKQSKRMKFVYDGELDQQFGDQFKPVQTKDQNQVKLYGNFPRLPISNSSDKIRIRHYKNQIIDQIGRNVQQDSCPICLTSFLENQDQKLVILDPCQHIMCNDCILEWANKYKTNCPTCRQLFVNLWPLKWIGERELEQGLTPLDFYPSAIKWDMEDDDFYYEPDDSDDNCQVCKRGINFSLMLICDGCNKSVCHTYCDPALKGNVIPDEEWYCMNCRATKICYNVSKKCEREIQRRATRQINRQTNERLGVKRSRARNIQTTRDDTRTHNNNSSNLRVYASNRMRTKT